MGNSHCNYIFILSGFIYKAMNKMNIKWFFPEKLMFLSCSVYWHRGAFGGEGVEKITVLQKAPAASDRWPSALQSLFFLLSPSLSALFPGLMPDWSHHWEHWHIPQTQPLWNTGNVIVTEVHSFPYIPHIAM